MKRTKTIAVLISALLLTLPAAAEMTREEAMKMAQQYGAQHSGSQDELPEPVQLTKKDVTGFIATIDQLKALGVEAQLDADEAGKLGMVDALAANEEAMSILSRNGFKPERFQQVVYSVGYAMAALEMKGKEGEIDQALTAQEEMLEKMKGQLTTEQLELIRSQSGMAKAAMHQIEDQPPGNLALVEEHLQEIRRVVESTPHRD